MFKRYLASLMLALLLPLSAWSQVEVQIQEEPVIGRLVQLVVPLEITQDENGLPSHTIEWDSDHPLLEYAVQPAPQVLIMPTGLRPDVVKIKVRVVDWVNRQISIDRVEVKIVGEAGEPPVVDPPGTDPPVDPQPDKWKKVEAKAAELFQLIADVKMAQELARHYEEAAAQFGDDINQARKLIQEARAKAFLGQPKLESQWNEALLEVSQLISEEEPLSPSDYKAAIMAVVRGLRSVNW